MLACVVLIACSDDEGSETPNLGGSDSGVGAAADLGTAHDLTPDGGVRSDASQTDDGGSSEDGGMRDGGDTRDGGDVMDGGDELTQQQLMMLLPPGSPSIDDHVNIELTVEQPNLPTISVDLSAPSLTQGFAFGLSSSGAALFEVPVPGEGGDVLQFDLLFLPSELQIPGLHPMYENTSENGIVTSDAPIIGIFTRQRGGETVGGGASTGHGAVRFDNCPPDEVDSVVEPGVPSTTMNRLEMTLGQVVFDSGIQPITVSGFISLPMGPGDGSFCN